MCYYCIGVTKQIASVDIKIQLYQCPFPHLLYELTFKRKIRLIHFSTDCVFSGSQVSTLKVKVMPPTFMVKPRV